jgi:hypothetical protein
VSVTTDRARRRSLATPGHGRLQAIILLTALLLSGCVEEPLPQRPITREDCLRTVNLEKLPEALARCDKVVAAFPKDPGPLNERFLLHTLAGDTAAACRDIAKATALAARIPRDKLDPILREDLEVRRKSCREDVEAGGTGKAPAASATAGSGPRKTPAPAPAQN